MSNEQQGRKTYRRTTFVINSSFQFKYTGIIVAIGVGIAILLGIFLYNAHVENTDLLTGTVPEGSELFNEIKSTDNNVVVYLSLFVLAMGVSLFVWGIFVTHRIAGPIFILTRYLNVLADGDFPDIRPLRKRDEMKEVHTALYRVLGKIKENEQLDIETLDKIIKAAEGSGLEASTLNLITNMRDRKKAAASN